MKKVILLFALLCACLLRAQEIEVLEPLEKWDTIPWGKAVIYGNFIQGTGSKGGSVPQFIHLQNAETRKFYSIQVKPTMTSAEENSFIYAIRPGKYIIARYKFSEKGIKPPTVLSMTTITYTYYVLPNGELTGAKSGADSAEQNTIDQDRITFEIKGRTLNYLGTWDFRGMKVFFTSEKEKLDPELKKYKKLDFNQALISLPTPTAGFTVPFLPTGYINDPSNESDIEVNRLVEKRQINIAPLYGGVKKTLRQKEYDRTFIDTALHDCKCTRQDASKRFSDKGWNYFDSGNNEMASKRFNQAWLLDTANYSLYWGFGDILGSQSRYGEALPFFKRAYSLKQNRNDTLQARLCRDYAFTLSSLLRETKNGEYLKQSLELLDEAEKIYPDWGALHKERSKLFFLAGLNEEALKSYEKSVALDPKLENKKYYKELKARISSGK